MCGRLSQVMRLHALVSSQSISETTAQQAVEDLLEGTYADTTQALEALDIAVEYSRQRLAKAVMPAFACSADFQRLTERMFLAALAGPPPPISWPAVGSSGWICGFAAMADAASEGIILIDIREQSVFYANQSLCQWTGYSGTELAGLHVKDLCEQLVDPRTVAGRYADPSHATPKQEGRCFRLSDIEAGYEQRATRVLLKGKHRDKGMDKQVIDLWGEVDELFECNTFDLLGGQLFSASSDIAVLHLARLVEELHEVAVQELNRLAAKE
eukprot:1635476-Prymnesium_polylepis.1